MLPMCMEAGGTLSEHVAITEIGAEMAGKDRIMVWALTTENNMIGRTGNADRHFNQGPHFFNPYHWDKNRTKTYHGHL